MAEHEPLYTKYRPRTFDEVVGQDAVVKSLRSLCDGNTHTFLLTGPSGCGKTTLARIAADEVDAELQEIDAATHTGVDDMRQVAESLRYKPFGGKKRKAVLLDECHSLSKNSWQSLLKILEEPPEHAYWFLCTTEPGKVQDTVHTRGASYDLSPVDGDTLFDLLAKVDEQEDLGTSDDVLDLISSNAEGSPRKALVYLEQCRGVQGRKEAGDLIKVAGDEKEVIDLCRWLAAGQGLTWKKAVQHLKPLQEMNAESVRLTVVNYFNSVALGTTSDKKAQWALTVLDAFSEPCNQSDKIAPILRSVGELMFTE